MGHALNEHHYQPLSPDNREESEESKERQGVTFHRNQKFRDVLTPLLVVQFLFGLSYNLRKSVLFLCLSKLLLCFWIVGLSLVFGFAVFNRNTMDMWVQFSLYIIPVLSFPIAAYIFSSSAYYRLLQRRITHNVSVRFFISNNVFVDGEASAAAHNYQWLKEISIKSILYPFMLEIIQWVTFLFFYLLGNPETVLGNVKDLNSEFWKPLYIFNWCITVYFVAFVAYQFVFVSRLIVKDTVHLMSLFGKTSYLQLYPVYTFSIRNNICFKILSGLANFLTMDLFNAFHDERIYSDCAEVNRSSPNTGQSSPGLFPTRNLHSPFGSDGNGNQEGSGLEKSACKLTPSEACEIFSVFIAEVESLTSIFVPFNIVIAFFGVADLFTHVGLFVKKEGSISYWTLFRTLLFLLVAFRMMICVLRISSVLSKLLPHINLIKTAGKLHCDYQQKPNWNDFTDLVASYNLSQRTFGFPMSIRQIASFVSVMYLSLYIIFAVVSKTHGAQGGISNTAGPSPQTMMNLTLLG